MNTIHDLRDVLSEDARRLQAPAGLEARVLERALRSSTAADAPNARRLGSLRSSVEAPRLAALVAVVIALAIVLSLVFTAQVLRLKPNPATHGHVCVQGQTELVGAVNCLLSPADIRQPIALRPGFALDCSRATCGMQAPVFNTPSLGWMTAGYQGAGAQTDLYQTQDGGSHWKALLSWDGPGMSDLKVSRNGQEVLIVTGWGQNGPGLFYTSDGGAQWASFGVPMLAACSGTGGACHYELRRIYFLNPREGWVLVQESALVGQLFHTADSGAHWTLTAGIDALSAFNKYMLIHQGLNGQLVFQDSSEGWFVPDFSSVSTNPLFVYRTSNGGASWQLQTIPTPTGGINLVNLKFFSDREGLLEFRQAGDRSSPTGRTYVSTTLDGGATWSRPIQIPLEDYGGPGAGMDLLTTGGNDAVDFIDIQDWVEIGAAGLQRTSDAGKHWTTVATTSSGCCWLDFVDVSHGWSIVSTEVNVGLIRTTDGGVTWVPVNWPSPARDFYMP